MPGKENEKRSGFLALNRRGREIRRFLKAGTNITIQYPDGRDGNPVINSSGGSSGVQWVKGTGEGGTHIGAAALSLYTGMEVVGAAQAGDTLQVFFSCIYERQYTATATTADLIVRISSGTAENIGWLDLALLSGDTRKATGLVGYDDAIAAGLISGGNITVGIYTQNATNMRFKDGRMTATLFRS
jgi:hypothetical protein